MVCRHKFFYAEYFYLFADFSLFYYYFHHRFYFNISIKAQLLLDFFDSLSRHESVCFFIGIIKSAPLRKKWGLFWE